MKSAFLSLILLFIGVQSFATIHSVTVANFQFNPANFSAQVGDTVRWTWSSGSHTTTSGNNNGGIPVGAASWNENINSGNTTYEYVITIPGTYNYRCIPHSPEMIGQFTASGVFPVTLFDFKVSATSNNKALISWKTASENNSDHFSVMKSFDGSSFSEFATVKAAGKSDEIRSYSVTDNNISNAYKYTYYKLEIFDRDGSKSTSDIQLFLNKQAISKMILSLSPNPVTRPAHIMLQFNADKAGSLLAQLYDSKGVLIKQTNMLAVPGINNGHFHIGDVPSGMYNIVFTLNELKESKQILIQ